MRLLFSYLCSVFLYTYCGADTQANCTFEDIRGTWVFSSTQFFWRDWLVIVAAVHGSDKFVNHACEVNQHDNHGRSIVVASVDKTIKATNSHTASSSLHALTLYRSFIGHGDLKRHYVCINSNDAYSHLPDSARNHCNTYAAAGVMCSHSADSHVHAASGRYHSYTPHSTANTAYVFG